MPTPYALIALCACVTLLSACDKTPSKPPMPSLSMPLPSASGAPAGVPTDPSLPSASSVFPPGSAAKADPTLGPGDGTRKPAQESETKPMPGQNNDHSAPLGPAK